MKKLVLIFVLGLFFTSCFEEDFLPNDGSTDTSTETFPEDGEWDDWDSEDSGATEGSLSLYAVDGDEINLINDYEVEASLEGFQDDKPRHYKIWEHVTRLIPVEYRSKISQFEVFHGGGELSGYASPLDENDLSKWKFAMAIDLEGDLDVLDFQNYYTYVTLHEFGHVLTLNNTQVDVKDEWDCNTYFTGEGCSKEHSYINAIFELGWEDIIDFHDFDYPEDTYDEYSERFLSEYAATNPGEDVAEVFSYFIMTPDNSQAHSIAEEKIKLFYEYEELVRLRNDIRNRVGPPGLTMPNKSMMVQRVGCKHHSKRK